MAGLVQSIDDFIGNLKEHEVIRIPHPENSKYSLDVSNNFQHTKITRVPYWISNFPHTNKWDVKSGKERFVDTCKLFVPGNKAFAKLLWETGYSSVENSEDPSAYQQITLIYLKGGMPISGDVDEKIKLLRTKVVPLLDSEIGYMRKDIFKTNGNVDAPTLMDKLNPLVFISPQLIKNGVELKKTKPNSALYTRFVFKK